MRMFLWPTLLLAACSQEQASPGISAGQFAGTGRDALCIAGKAGDQRAGFIAYGSDGSNCSARGKVVAAGQAFELVPQGEGDCRIPLIIGESSISLGKAPAACEYYCGPGASLKGQSFQRAGSGSDIGVKMVDFAGDPLC